MDSRTLLLVTLTICFAYAEGNTVKVNDFLFSGGLEFLDLSYPYDNHTAYWPGGKKFQFTKKHTGKNPTGKWYSANEFCTAEHGGTHLDAPYHFGYSQWTVGQIPFEHLITPLVVVDLSILVSGNNDFVLERHHMDNLFLGDPKRNFTVLFRFGWSEYYGNLEKYFGSRTPTPDNVNFPGISEDVARWITENKNLVGVGVDTPSVDPGSVRGLAHAIFASHNIFMMENVKIDKVIPSHLCAIMVMPMKIQDGTGAPCRITAICPKLHAGDLF